MEAQQSEGPVNVDLMVRYILLASEVAKMRRLQKEYFRGRDRGILIESKQTEKVVDQLLVELGQKPV